MTRARLEIHWIPSGSDLSCSTSSISGWKTNIADRQYRLFLLQPAGHEVGWPPKKSPPLCAPASPCLPKASAAVALGQGCSPTSEGPRQRPGSQEQARLILAKTKGAWGPVPGGSGLGSLELFYPLGS